MALTLGECEALEDRHRVTLSEDVGEELWQALCEALAQAQDVALSVALCDEDTEPLAQGLGEGVAQCEADGEALKEGVALPQAVAIVLPDGEGVALGLWLEL